MAPISLKKGIIDVYATELVKHVIDLQVSLGISFYFWDGGGGRGGGGVKSRDKRRMFLFINPKLVLWSSFCKYPWKW